jgi:hypothetical protein
LSHLVEVEEPCPSSELATLQQPSSAFLETLPLHDKVRLLGMVMRLGKVQPSDSKTFERPASGSSELSPSSSSPASDNSPLPQQRPQTASNPLTTQ